MIRCFLLLLSVFLVLTTGYAGSKYVLGKYDPAKKHTKYINGLTKYSQGNTNGDAIATSYYEQRRDAMQRAVDHDTRFGYKRSDSQYNDIACLSRFFQYMDENYVVQDTLTTVQDYIDATKNYAWKKSLKYRGALCERLTEAVGGFDRADILNLLDNSDFAAKPDALKILLTRYGVIGMDQTEFFTRVDGWKMPHYIGIIDNIETHFDNAVIPHLALLRRIVNRINDFDVAEPEVTSRFMDPVDKGFLAKLVSAKSGILVGDPEVGDLIAGWQAAVVAGAKALGATEAEALDAFMRNVIRENEGKMTDEQLKDFVEVVLGYEAGVLEATAELLREIYT